MNRTMVELRPSALRVASAVVSAERARTDAAPSSVAAQIARALDDRIGTVIGSGGFDVLLSRSLVVARRTRPILARVDVAPGALLTFSDDATSDPSALWPALAGLFATIVELLAELIGEDLALRIVLEAWPEAGRMTPDENEKR